MSIKRTIITTLVALTLVAVVAPVVASATTVSDLQASINALEAQLTALQGTTGTTPVPTGSVACSGVTFTRNLTVGSVGQDVKCMQVLLNTNGYTLATTGAGSPGMETTYFGTRTLAGVKTWQKAMGWAPANQVGPLSRAKLNSWLSGAVVVLPGQPTPTPSPVGSVSAMVATDNPASGALICGQATAGLLNINFTGTGTVTSVTLQRTGISDQNTLTNVYLFDGNTRLTDGYSFNVNGTLTMNGLSIPVNGSHEISVRADVESNTGSPVVYCTSTSSSISVALTGFNGGSSMVQGNTQSIVTGSAASAYLGADSVNNTGTVQPVSAGTTQYTMWSAPLQVNTRAVSVKGANFRMIGSAPTTAISNVRMFVDGVDTGKTATLTSTNGSSYETFDLTSAPITLTTGSHQIDVRADITGGSSRTVQLSVQQASDITVYDPQIGVNISVTGPSGAIFGANQGANVSISAGSATVNIDPTFNTQTNVTGGSSNATIAKYVLHGYGEDVKVMNLTVTPSITSACTGTGATTFGGTNCANSTLNDANRNNWASGNGLQNVTLYFNGSQVGSQQNYTGTALTFNLGSQMVLPAGQDSTIEVRADLQTSGNVAYTVGTVSATIGSGSGSNAQGNSSQTTFSVPATSPSGLHSLSITTGGLQVAPNPSFSATSVGPNSTKSVIGSFTVQNQSSSESIRLTQLTVGLTTNGTTPLDSTTTPKLTDLSSLQVVAENAANLGGSTTTPVGQVSASNVISASYQLQPGAQVILDVVANVGSNASSVMKTTLTVASTGVTSNLPNNGTLQTGPQITFSSGTLAAPVKSSGTSDPQYIAAGGTSSSYSEAEFSFVSAGSSSTINELQFTVTGGPIQKICLDLACTQAFYPTGSTVDMKGLNLSIPQIQSYKPFYIYYPTVGINGGIQSNTTATVALTYIQYTSGNNTVTLTNNATGSPVTCNTTTQTACLGVNSIGVLSNQMTLVGAVPAVSVATSSGASLAVDGTSDNVIGSFTVAAGSQGGVAVNTLVFNVGMSGYSGTPQIGASSTSAYITKHGSSTHLGTCTGGGTGSATATITCLLGGTGTAGAGHFSTDSQISQNGSIQYDLHDAVTASPSTSGSAVRISSTLNQGGFVWDDASWNGTYGTGLTGTLISGFPTGSYSIGQ